MVLKPNECFLKGVRCLAAFLGLCLCLLNSKKQVSPFPSPQDLPPPCSAHLFCFVAAGKPAQCKNAQTNLQDLLQGGFAVGSYRKFVLFAGFRLWQIKARCPFQNEFAAVHPFCAFCSAQCFCFGPQRSLPSASTHSQTCRSCCRVDSLLGRWQSVR